MIPRREDGQDTYDFPGGRADRWNAYFALPDNFWIDEIFAKLTLPGLAMLLIVAKETNAKDEMYLPYAEGQKWYGISAKSVQNGLADLEKNGLLHRREELRRATLSATGLTTKTWYSLKGPFGHQSRAALQKTARQERRSRLRRQKRDTAEGAKK